MKQKRIEAQKRPLVLVRQALRRRASLERARQAKRFFKTAVGEYGYGDRFLGVTVPDTRRVAREYDALSQGELATLLHSPFHEERLLGLLILVARFQKGNRKERKTVYRFYLANLRGVNNWDLVDLSAGHIVGGYLSDKPRRLLYRLASSKNVWERRIAIIATFYFIRLGDFSDTLALSDQLLTDEHDLIHKAVGWMLREVGKQSIGTEEAYLKKHYRKMPRTMLRYAIERFPEKRRQGYLRGIV